MTKRKLRYSGLGLAVLMVGAVAACSSDNTSTPGGGGSGPTAGSNSGGKSGGTAGAGGSGATAGTTAAAGTGTGGTSTAGTGSGGTAGFACTNTMPACALITDGANLVVDATRAGDFKISGGIEGGTYSYQPSGVLKLDSLGSTALNVKGNVKNYDGFGIFFNTCYDVKTLGYTGVSFSIKGNAGPTGKLSFRVQTNSNTAANDPQNTTNKKGTCIAANPSDPYPDCHAAGKEIPVTSTATVVTVNFADLAGGLPTAGVNGADVVGLEWALPWMTGGFGTGAGGAAAGGASTGGSGGASGGNAGKGGSSSGGTSAAGSSAGGAAPSDGSYNVDITIDDVKFLGGPATPATCTTTGTGGSGAGGASTGGGSSTAGAGGASAGSGGASGGAGGKGGSGGA